MITIAAIVEDLVVGRSQGDLSGPEIPPVLLPLPDDRLRFDPNADDGAGAVIDAAGITEWFVDHAGSKHLAQDAEETRQPLSCAWDAPLIREGGAWRVRTIADGLIAYVAAKRWAVETAGIAVGGQTIHTDRQSQSMIAGAYLAVQRDPDRVIRFKAASGWVDLDAAMLTAIADAVADHVQACFALEAELSAEIAAGEITTTAEIDAAHWPATAG